MNAIINGRSVTFSEGETILAVARNNGIFIPSLCAFAPLGHKPGVCRVCLVQCTPAGGEARMVPACATPLAEGMSIVTDSADMRARQRLQVEMVVADHDLACDACARHGECELQDLRRQLGCAANPYPPRGALRPADAGGAMRRDMSKCVRCQRCVAACAKQGIHAMRVDTTNTEEQVMQWNKDACIRCGQCILACPVGALAECDDTATVMDWLAQPDTFTAFILDLSPGDSLAQGLGLASGTPVQGLMISALRYMGAKAVLPHAPHNALAAAKVGQELAQRLKAGETGSLFTSCCPGWMKRVQALPELQSLLSQAESPLALAASIDKKALATAFGVAEANIRTILVSPCLSGKDDIAADKHAGLDLAISERELVRLLTLAGIDLSLVAPGAFDQLPDAKLPAATGIFMQMVLESAAQALGGQPAPLDLAPVQGSEGLAEATVSLAGKSIRVAVCKNLALAQQLAEQASKGQAPYALVEARACPGGHPHGGGTCRVAQCC